MTVFSGHGDDLTRPAIPAIYGAQLVELAQRFGVASDELLRGTGLDASTLDGVDARIAPVTMASLVGRALKLTGEPGLGFHHGLQLKLSSHGAVGLLAMTSATFGEAIRAAERYVALRSPYVRLHLYVEDDRAVVELVHQLADERMRVFAIESLFTAIAHMTRMLLGRAVTGSFEVFFDEPPYFRRFAHLWPGTVRFAQRQNRLLFPAAWLDESLHMADAITARQLARECEQELTRLTVTEPLNVRATRFVRASADGEVPSLIEAAKACHVSERTLKRRLAAEGTSYRQIVELVRKERARELLKQPEHSIEQVAARCGYSDAANFHRAFRRWYGCGPDAFRKQLGR